MAHIPGSYGATYCEDNRVLLEDNREVVRGPYGSYKSDYRILEYDDLGYPRHHHHNGGYAGVDEVVSYQSNLGHHHHHHGGVAEVIEKKEEILYEKPCDPYRSRNY